jgi:YbbR domain-containing protein
LIRISGAADKVDKITYVETEPLNIKNSSDSLTVKLNILKTPELKLVELFPQAVNATIYITKYTEASIDLPIEIENLPASFGLKIFPDKVSIKYHVAFQNYEKINALQFRAVVNYAKMEPGSNKLKIQLVKYPAEISSVTLDPEKVEYIIRK